jgi:hypothetical protein
MEEEVYKGQIKLSWSSILMDLTKRIELRASLYLRLTGRKKRSYRLRDSYTPLTTKLATLAKTLCPELGSKGSIAHDEVQVSNLKKLSAKLFQKA